MRWALTGGPAEWRKQDIDEDEDEIQNDSVSEVDAPEVRHDDHLLD